MTELQPVTEPSGAERRRSPRVRLAVLLQATWTNEQGRRTSEYAETEVFNAQGGLLCMKTGLPIPMEIQLTNPQTQGSRDTFDPQTNVIVRFSLASGHTIQAEGVVIHSLLGVHMGIKFIQLKDDDRKVIEHFVKQVATLATHELS